MNSPSILISKTKKFEELESIRGIAALIVVLEHFPNWNSAFFDISIIRNGYLMVELFFVLSGFVIYNAYANNIKNRQDLFRFQFLRFGRLYPVHLFFLIIFLGVECLKYIFSTYYGINSPNSEPFVINNESNFITHLFLAQALGVTDQVGSFNSPSWSISAEFYTYLLFALIILRLNKWRILAFGGILITSYIALRIPEFGRFSYLLICLIGFSIGCLISALISFKKFKVPSYAPHIVIIILFLFLSQFPISQLYPIIFLISAALIYTLVLSEDSFLKKILRLNIFKSLGEISYSIYMSHFLILWIANQFIRVVLKYPEVIIKGDSFPQLTVSEAVIAYLIVITATILTSKLTFRYIEKPLREKSRVFAFRVFPKAEDLNSIEMKNTPVK